MIFISTSSNVTSWEEYNEVENLLRPFYFLQNVVNSDQGIFRSGAFLEVAFKLRANTWFRNDSAWIRLAIDILDNAGQNVETALTWKKTDNNRTRPRQGPRGGQSSDEIWVSHCEFFFGISRIFSLIDNPTKLTISKQ